MSHAPQPSAPPLLELRNASKRFGVAQGWVAREAQRLGWHTAPPMVQAVDRVSLSIHEGEVVGLVGESGCGKSTLGRLVAGLHSLTQGERWWQGENVQVLEQRLSSNAFRRQMLGVQMVFQDPSASLNRRLRVRDLIGEAPVVHGLIPAAAQADRVAELLKQVGLDPDLMERYAHDFSVGQRARIGIARALAVNPRLLVCDEAVASLDVSIQAQVINLFMALRASMNLTYLFISHDLRMVQHICDRVVVMYLGRVVESGSVEAVFGDPQHPYTQALLADSPQWTVGKTAFAASQGEMPSPLHPPAGCHFHPRCPQAMPRCSQEPPALLVRRERHEVACHWTAPPSDLQREPSWPPNGPFSALFGEAADG